MRDLDFDEGLRHGFTPSVCSGQQLRDEFLRDSGSSFIGEVGDYDIASRFINGMLVLLFIGYDLDFS